MSSAPVSEFTVSAPVEADHVTPIVQPPCDTVAFVELYDQSAAPATETAARNAMVACLISFTVMANSFTPKGD